MNNRDSNIELLRLLCMLFIVILHFCVHSLYSDVQDFSTADMITSNLTRGFVIIAVNCFVLISGYYGIRLKWKSVLNLYLTCAFYGLIAYCIHLHVDNAHVGFSLLKSSVFIFSNCKWWFISAYIILMLFAPLLNSAIEHFSRKQHVWCIVLFTILQIYLGYGWHSDLCDDSGFHFLNFIYLYLIGQYIARYVSVDFINKHRWKWLAIYILCSLCWAGISIISSKNDIPLWHPYAYNNPIVIISALAFFCFMSSFHFHSKVINWLASSALAVYLVQEAPYLKSIWYDGAKNVCEWSGLGKVGCLFAISFLFFFAILLIDKIRYYLFQYLFKVIESIQRRK